MHDFSIIPTKYMKRIDDNAEKPLFYLFDVTDGEIDTYGYENRTVDFEWTLVIAEIRTPITGADFLHHYDLRPDLRKKRLIHETQISFEGQIRKTQTPRQAS